MCISEADIIAYRQMIQDAESKQELREELQYIRDDIASKYGNTDDSDEEEGGFSRKLKR